MENLKNFQVRLEKDLWLFLKKVSYEKEISMNAVITLLIANYKKKYKK